MIPARFAPILFGLILSGVMSFLVSGIVTLRATGSLEGWIGAWLPSWGVAFPTVLVVAPIARRLVSKLVRAD
ncbi:DUF2798 domain-containing protein [Roseobacteraceae bacterium S113]